MRDAHEYYESVYQQEVMKAEQLIEAKNVVREQWRKHYSKIENLLSELEIEDIREAFNESDLIIEMVNSISDENAIRALMYCKAIISSYWVPIKVEEKVEGMTLED